MAGAVILALQLGFALMLGIAAVGAARRIGVWRRGAAAEVPILAGLAAMPRRYLRDVHAVVARDPAAARMHMLAAGGFVAATLLFLASLLAAPAPLRWLGLVACVALLAGAGLAARRRGKAPGTAHRSGGEWRLLAPALGVVALGYLGWFGALAGGDAPGWLALPVGAALLLGWGVLIAGLSRGPMRHALAGALHLAFHPRPERFGAARPAAALRPLPPDAERLGVGAVEDLAWNRVLGFDACVQCGRCEAACPAFAAGQPLNPKKLVHDINRASGAAALGGAYAGNGHPGLPAPIQAGVMVDDRTLWSCTTCRACVQECPMMIEHVDAVVDLRRFAVMERGAAPPKVVEAIETLRATDTLGGRALADRWTWAADLGLPRIADRPGAEVLLWVGEAGFAPRSHRTLRALVALLRAAWVDFAVLGEEEPDCGDTARRLGEELLFADQARRAIALLSRHRFGRIVTADPHAFNLLRNEYPAFGGVFEVQHHTQFLAELLRAGRLETTGRIEGSITFHDPCYLGRHNGETAAPREILRRIAPGLVEMERSGLRARCCGGGGGAPLADIPGERRIADMRMQDAQRAGAATVAVGCPTCMAMLEGVTGPRPAVADIAELLAACLTTDAPR